ncbi:MAG: hypothetical protein ABSF22_11060 [Bryobacteraceae bacterium]
MLIVCSFETAHASPLFGIVSSGSEGGTAIQQQTWNTGGYLSLASYASPVLSGSGSFQVAGANTVTGTDSASAWFSADGDGGFHGYASSAASLNNAAINEGAQGDTAGSFTGIWTDTLYVVGLPAGTPVEIQLTNSLNSFASYSGGASANVSITEGASISGTRSAPVSSTFSNYDGQTYTPSNGLQTQTLVLQTFSGDILQLQVQLEGAATSGGVPQGLLSASALADVSDTANAFITVLTPGASYTSASGVVYSDSDVPEPGNLWLCSVAAFGIWLARRRRSAVGH